MELWDQVDNEHSRAYYAFTVFRDLGPGRNVTETAQTVFPALANQPPTQKDLKTIQNWAYQYKWRTRAEAWDLHLDRKAREAQIAKVTEMNEKHAEAGKALWQQAAANIQILTENHQRALESGDEDLIRETMIPVQYLKGWLETGINIERMARELPSEIINVSGNIRTENLSYEERVILLKQLTKVNNDGKLGPGQTVNIIDFDVDEAIRELEE